MEIEASTKIVCFHKNVDGKLCSDLLFWSTEDELSPLFLQMKLRKELLMCMEHATANNKISIAFPAVGTGGLHYPPQMVAHAFKRAVDDMGIKGVNLKVG